MKCDTEFCTKEALVLSEHITKGKLNLCLDCYGWLATFGLIKEKKKEKEKEKDNHSSSSPKLSSAQV